MGKLHYLKGDLLNAPQKIIAHQVNCQGVMGSGVAYQIKQSYGDAYLLYKNLCNFKSPLQNAGSCQLVEISDNRIVANLFGQVNFGGPHIETSYAYLAMALNELFVTIRENEELPNEFAIPYLMSCYRGGGDWDVVSSILEDFAIKYDIDVYIYSLN